MLLLLLLSWPTGGCCWHVWLRWLLCQAQTTAAQTESMQDTQKQPMHYERVVVPPLGM